MADVIFEAPPYTTLLQKLARGSLEQSQNLSLAIRQWVNLRWLYSGESTVSDQFDLTNWRQAFYSSTHPKSETREEVLAHKDPNCACTKKTEDWLLNWGIHVEAWRLSLQKQISISERDIEEVLQERLFAQTRKTLQKNLNQLVDLDWLYLAANEVNSRSRNYCRVDNIPSGFEQTENIDFYSNIIDDDPADLAQALDMLSFLDPRLSPFAEKISLQVCGTRRVFLHVDYVVPEATQHEVDDVQEQFQQIWKSAEIEPVLLTYDSASLNQVKECVVYPVCIYYVQRARYLCAYGSSPNGEINWYNYRLDRIRCQHLIELSWLDPRVPHLLLEKYQNNQLPSPEEVETNMGEAWGFDFYRRSSLMLLRFDRDYHDRYIQGTFRHQTFTSIDYDKAIALVKQETLHPQLQSCLNILHSRSPSDAYYQVKYRVDDNNVVMRLRAWGAKVEILLPWDLRVRITKDLQDAWNLYK